MVTTYLVLFGEIVQIPAYGLRADVEMAHQVFRRDKSLPRQDVQYLQMSLGLFHACTPMMKRKKAPADAGPFGVYLIPFGIDKVRITFYALLAAALAATAIFSCLRVMASKTMEITQDAVSTMKPPSQPKWSTV
jgi:hypothetical protein